MDIIVNGEETALEAPLHIKDMLAQLGYEDMTVAVARNGTFVTKSTYEDVTLEEGDQIEIVAPMQGG